MDLREDLQRVQIIRLRFWGIAFGAAYARLPWRAWSAQTRRVLEGAHALFHSALLCSVLVVLDFACL